MVLKQESPPFLLLGTKKAHIFMQTIYFRIISNWDVLDCEVLTTDS